MKKYINTVGWVIGTLMGTIMGLCISLWLIKETVLKSNEAYESGKKDAQKECVELIKSTK